MRRVARFTLVFFALTALYGLARDTPVERWFIEWVTVRPAAAIAHRIAPDMPIVVAGARLVSPRGSVTVLNGCEGSDAIFMVVAAFAAAPLSWPSRLVGAACGASIAFAVNQARVVTLFFLAQNASDAFALLHTFVLPLIVVGVIGAWYAWFLHRHASWV